MNCIIYNLKFKIWGLVFVYWWSNTCFKFKHWENMWNFLGTLFLEWSDWPMFFLLRCWCVLVLILELDNTLSILNYSYNENEWLAHHQHFDVFVVWFLLVFEYFRMSYSWPKIFSIPYFTLTTPVWKSMLLIINYTNYWAVLFLFLIYYFQPKAISWKKMLRENKKGMCHEYLEVGCVVMTYVHL